MSLIGRFWSSLRREVTVYYGGATRDAVLGMGIEEVYRTQPELQAVVSFIASSVAQLPLKCYVRESDESRRRDTEGPLPLLLADPGADVTGYELVLGTVSDVALYGWSLWWVLPSADKPSGWELRRICPGWAKVRTTDGFSPSSYEVRNPTASGVPVRVPADQCVRFSTYNPGEPLVPLSPVDSLRHVLAERASSRDFRNKVWRNGGWFSRYIERPAQDGEWGAEARTRFAKSMKDRFSGPEGVDSGGIPILEDGMKFVESRLNAKEAEWAESMRLTREDVAAAYHLNPAQVWSNDGQTYASVKENARSLYTDTLGPYLRMIHDRIGLTLVPMIGADPRCYAEFDLTAKLAGSFEEQASVMSQSTGGPWMTRNEARAKQNLPAIEGGDELIVPMNVTEGGLASPHDTDPTKGVLPLGFTRGGVLRALPQRSWHAVDGARCMARRTSAKSKLVDLTSKDVEAVLRSFYERQATSIANQLAAMDPDDISIGGYMEWWHKDRWVRELSRDLREAVEPPAMRAAREAMLDLGANPESLDGSKVRQLMLELCERRADDIVQSTLEQLADDLLEATRSRELDAETVRKTVADSYGRLMDSRVTRNGPSLANAVVNSSTFVGARQSGVRCQKEWVHSPSVNPRSKHARMDGERVVLGNSFSNGAMWPGDPYLGPEETCNCHCKIAIVAGEDRATGDYLRDVRKDAEDLQKRVNAEWQSFRKDENEEGYFRTLGEFLSTLSDAGEVSASYRSKPKGKEVQAVRQLARLGHNIQFLSDAGKGKHPDIIIDGVVADLKRIKAFSPNRVYKRIKHAVEQGAECAIIDLAYDTVTLDEALGKAQEAIDDGVIKRGCVIILDWHGGEHIV